MIVLLIVCALIIVDLILCGVFCSHKKKMSEFNCDSLKEVEKMMSARICYTGFDSDDEFLSGGGVSPSGLKHFIRLWMGSLLRLNLFLVSYIPSHTIRNLLYRGVFKVNLSKGAVIYYGAEIRSPWNLYIATGAVIGDKALLDARFGIYIGENVNFSTGAWIYTLQHNVQSPDFSTEGEGKPVVIKDRAWVSTRTTVLPGNVIEEGSVIAAGAVVTKSTEPYTINGGVPCKKIGERTRELNYQFTGEHQHFL